MLQTTSLGMVSGAHLKRPGTVGFATPRAGARLEHKSAARPVQQLHAICRDLMQDGAGWPVVKLSIAIVVVLIGNMVGQVRLNEWNGDFFDAVQSRNSDALLSQLIAFLLIVAGLLSLVVAQTWLQERLKIRLRERLTQCLLDAWLKPRRAYQLGLLGRTGSQPDQRVQEDCRLVAELTTELGVGMLQSLMLLVSFIGVLWALSSYATFDFGQGQVAVPGYMVWVAVGYAAVGSGLTWLVGRPLIRLNTERYAREADLRFALVRVNESAESIALCSGESDERRTLDRATGEVLKSMRHLSGALARLTWITSGYGWLGIVVPVLAAAPGYFGGRLSFGEMMMVVGAFNQVQGALRYMVDNFPKIADWRSAVLRVTSFREAAVSLEEGCHGSKIDVVPHPHGGLRLDDLSLSLQDGGPIVDRISLDVCPGERVLIKGESGSGKSTVFRAIAGLWPWGRGAIQVPPSDEQMFMPQRPYLPLGSLRAALCYPASADAFGHDEVRAALARCGLSEFADVMDCEKRWDQSLSLGQQQRVAFARLLLHKPRWIFMDEATSALDDASQASMLSLFERELAEATVLSIGHRPGLEAFHTRTISVRKATSGALVRPTDPGQAPSGRSYARLRPGEMHRLAVC